MAEDGTAYVAWLNAESAIASSMKIGEVADSLLVNVAKISKDDAVTVKPVSSQTPNSMPAVPRICIASDQPCVAWYTNEIGPDAKESQVIGLSGGHETCFARPIENAGFDGEWSITAKPMLDANGTKAEGAITSFALGSLESAPACAWTLDPDFLQNADAGTGSLDNSHLFLATCEGNQAQVASKAANAQFAKKGSTDVLTFYQDGAIMSVQSAHAQPDVVLSNDEATAVPSANYLVTGDLASHAMISYIVAGDGATDIHAQVLDGGAWSEEAATGAELARANIPALKSQETFRYAYTAPKKMLSANGIKTVIVRIEGRGTQAGSIASQTSVAAWVPGPNAIVGETYVVAGNTYKVTSNAKGTAMLVKAKNAKKVTVPATVSIEGKTYCVTAIGAKAFKSAKGKLKTVVLGKNVKSIGKRAFSGCKKLKKKTVKNSLRGSSIKTVKVKVGGKMANKKYKRKYKKIFKKKVCGKKVDVK